MNLNHCSIDDNDDTNRKSLKKQYIKPILKMPSSLFHNKPKDHSPRTVRFMDVMNSSKCNSPIDKEEPTYDDDADDDAAADDECFHVHEKTISSSTSPSSLSINDIKVHDNYIHDLHNLHNQYVNSLNELHDKYFKEK